MQAFGYFARSSTCYVPCYSDEKFLNLDELGQTINILSLRGMMWIVEQNTPPPKIEKNEE